MARTSVKTRISGRARIAGTAKLPQTGTYTATETGAREAAAIKNAYQTQRALLNAAGDTADFEKFIQRGMKRNGRP